MRLPIYLDHNATTPLDPGALQAMLPYFTEHFGNPSSADHVHGVEAARAVEKARGQVARLIGAEPDEIVFTASCTEANNLAILGVARAQSERRHAITSRIEHPAVLESFAQLVAEGWEVSFIDVDDQGLVDVTQLAGAIRPDTALVSIMAANNEVGTVQPLREIGDLCTSRGVLFHSDLAQAAACIDIDVRRDGLHLGSLSAHKAYGPKGVGALYVRGRRPRVKLRPIVFGGGQERGLRSGTLNTPLIVGMGFAFEAHRLRQRETDKVHALACRLRDRMLGGIPDLALNGHPVRRLPNSLSFSLPDVEPLALIRLLREKISFSASSACSSDSVKTSHVLLALYADGWRARNAFRLAVGRTTTEAEVDYAADALIEGVSMLRGAIAKSA